MCVGRCHYPPTHPPTAVLSSCELSGVPLCEPRPTTYVLWRCAHSPTASTIPHTTHCTTRCTTHHTLHHTPHAAPHTAPHHTLQHTPHAAPHTTHCNTHHTLHHTLHLTPHAAPHTTHCNTHHTLQHTPHAAPHTTRCTTHHTLQHTPHTAPHTTHHTLHHTPHAAPHTTHCNTHHTLHHTPHTTHCTTPHTAPHTAPHTTHCTTHHIPHAAPHTAPHTTHCTTHHTLQHTPPHTAPHTTHCTTHHADVTIHCLSPQTPRLEMLALHQQPLSQPSSKVAPHTPEGWGGVGQYCISVPPYRCGATAGPPVPQLPLPLHVLRPAGDAPLLTANGAQAQCWGIPRCQWQQLPAHLLRLQLLRGGCCGQLPPPLWGRLPGQSRCDWRGRVGVQTGQLHMFNAVTMRVM